VAAMRRIHAPGRRFEQHPQFDVPYALEVDDSLIEGVEIPLLVGYRIHMTCTRKLGLSKVGEKIGLPWLMIM
jgi:hypothetical protein